MYKRQSQIIGIHSRSNDLTVNCLTGKKLTNMRASGTDEAVVLVPPIRMTLEQMCIRDRLRPQPSSRAASCLCPCVCRSAVVSNRKRRGYSAGGVTL